MADSVLSFDSSLLNPPLSITDDERPPFKPLDSDNVNLSMKKSGRSAKQRRQLNRACASSRDVNEEQKKPRADRSLSHKSLPDLKQYKIPLTHPVLSGPKNHAWVDQKLQQLSSERCRGSSGRDLAWSGARGDELFHRNHCQRILVALRITYPLLHSTSHPTNHQRSLQL
jgi:hypothetical protein